MNDVRVTVSVDGLTELIQKIVRKTIREELKTARKEKMNYAVCADRLSAALHREVTPSAIRQHVHRGHFPSYGEGQQKVVDQREVEAYFGVVI